MPLPALPILAVIFAAKTAGSYLLYKHVKNNPESVGHWRDKMRDTLRGDKIKAGVENPPADDAPQEP